MLYRDEQEVPLTPKQVETLLALVEKHGEIVSKEALMSRLWRDTVVEEGNLIQNIYYLRRALGETSDGRQMIETRRRRGYRFNGELSDQVQGLSERQVDPQPVESENTDLVPQTIGGLNSSRVFEVPRGRLFASGAIAVVAIAAAIGFWVLRPAPSAVNKRQLAVLPLKPIDSVNRNDLYEIGIADEVINRLSVIDGLVVRPLGSVRDYGPGKDPVEAGREQSADYVLESTYQTAYGRIKVNSRLINVATGETEGTYPFKTDAEGIFGVQDAVASDLVNRLMAQFGAASTGRERKRGTQNEDAYLAYIQGWLLLDRGNTTLKEGDLGALGYFDRAVALDPNYARAWAAKGLAHDYAALKENGFEQYQYAVDAINRALLIDPGQSDAYAALCHEKLFYEWDYEGAETACRKAIELDPSSGPARMEYSILLSSRGRWDENFAQLKTAMESNPASYRLQWYYANSLYFSRRYDEAVAQYKKIIDLVPDRDTTYEDLIKALEQQGNTAEAFGWFIKLLMLRHEEDLVQRFQAAYRASGYRGVLRERSQTMPPSAAVFSQLGNKDMAFQILEERYDRHKWGVAVTAPVEPQLDPLRSDPRYADLIRRIEKR